MLAARHESISKKLRVWRSIALGTSLVSASCIHLISQRFDFLLAAWSQKQPLSGDLEKGLLLSEAFAHGSGVIAILLTLLVVDHVHRSQLWSASMYTAIVAAIANGAKYFLPRVRPNSENSVLSSYLENPLATSIDSTWLDVLSGFGRRSSELSFPSGHSATAIALAISLSLVYPKGRYLFAFFGTLACFQRIYVGAHYLSDCIGGVAIALLVASIFPFTMRSAD
jgi:membrane-associated phospholipid phosphatase